MESVEAVLVSHPKKDKNETGDPERKTENIESSIFFLHPDLAKKIAHVLPPKRVFKHDALKIAKYMPFFSWRRDGDEKKNRSWTFIPCPEPDKILVGDL
jgi:hypothetical protein